MTRGAAAALLLLGASGCWGPCEDVAPPPFPMCTEDLSLPEVAAALTFHDDVAPIVSAHCSSCHTDGGIGPFSLTTYEEVYTFRTAVRDAVMARRMPPFPPVSCCKDYVEDLALSPAEIATVVAWVDEGGQEGTPPAQPPPPPPTGSLERVDVRLELDEPYEPQTQDGGDDWRCFLLDWPGDEPSFITGFALRPSNPAVMHHALVMRIPEDRMSEYRRQEEESEGAGWPCEGGLPEILTGYVGGWSPGWREQVMPAEHGHRMEPGSGLAIQTHYSLPEREDQLGPDQPTVELMTVDDVENEIMAVGIYNATWPMGTMGIPAGEDDVKHAIQFDPTFYTGWNEPATILSVTLHMHDWGSAGTIGIRRADGSTECLLQIDEYDDEWQGNYTLVDPVELQPGDKLYMECHFDNSAANQPIVLGGQEPPRDLNWSEGADGEMCWGNIGVSRPRE